MLIPLDYAPGTCLRLKNIKRFQPDSLAVLLELCVLTADLLATFILLVGGRPCRN